jgi:ubiquinone/menaquinone biosynthesis C-methylase UbiE
MNETEQPVSADARLIPPKEMLHDGSSSPEEFVLFGDNFNQYILIPRAHLLPSEAVFDLGCGNGSVARALTRFLSPSGRYEGVDVNAAAIGWLQERYGSYPNFRFTHANVYNKVYNAGGRPTAGEYRFPFPDSSFDLVLLKSVFTHMLPADVHTYMREISRVLRQGGRSVITYFLLNEESRSYVERGLDTHALRHEYMGDPLCRVANPELPESVVAHDEGRIRKYYAEVGCSVVELEFGNWCGRTSLLGLQDVVIAVKEVVSSSSREPRVP